MKPQVLIVGAGPTGPGTASRALAVHARILEHYQQLGLSDRLVSKGTAGKVFSGERLPWIETADSDNFKPLRSFDWQIHIYGQASKELIEFA